MYIDNVLSLIPSVCVVFLANRSRCLFIYYGFAVASYSIDRNSDPEHQFSVSSKGLVTTSNFLDREKKSEHRIHVLAIDHGQSVAI